jgi:hypothetical protein
MKTRAFATSMLVVLLALIATVSVQAQSQRDRINVPFSFVIGGKVLPAGEYSVEPNRKDSLNVWLLKTQEGNTSVLFNTMPVRATKTQKNTKLVFTKYDDQYFLSEVWLAGENAGRELHVKRSQLEISKSRREEKIVIAGN